jgi:hypothetical protein
MTTTAVQSREGRSESEAVARPGAWELSDMDGERHRYTSNVARASSRNADPANRDQRRSELSSPNRSAKKRRASSS